MLIIAQGIATTVAPYLHLGYLAAYSDPGPVAYELLPIPVLVGLGLGAMLVYQGVRAILRRQRPRRLALTAAVCLWCLVMVWFIRAGPGTPPEEVTKTRASRILIMLQHRVRSDTDLPFQSLQEPEVNLPTFHYLVPGLAPSYSGPWFGEVRTDYWGREFELKSRIVTETESSSEWKRPTYWLVSAGPDGQFGTADDIVCEPEMR